MSLFLVSGKICSGKTTLAQYLVSQTELGEFKEFTLAGLLKEFTFKLLKTFDVPINSIADLDNRDTKERYRRYMQQIATECVRSTFGEDFWCERIEAKVRQALDNGINVIISDVRFPNEQEFFSKRFGDYFVHYIMIERSCCQQPLTHSSEDTRKLKIETVIQNNGSIDEFYNSIKTTISSMLPDPINEDNLIDLPEAEEEIVERAIALPPPPQVAAVAAVANNELFNELMNEKATTNSSQRLGVVGEETICQMLQQAAPKNTTYITAKTAHVADLQSIDEIHHIHWVIEVKNKGSLTSEDVDKFHRDISDRVKQTASRETKVMGLFLSLRSDSIPRYGDIAITRDAVYLSKRFITVDYLRLSIQFVESYIDLIKETKQAQTATEVTYVLPQQTIQLLAALNSEYQQSSKDMQLYDDMRASCKRNLAHIEELICRSYARSRMISMLNDQITSFEPIIEKSAYQYDYDRFITNIKLLKNISDVKKNETMSRYPKLSDRITEIGWDVFRSEAWRLTHSESTDTKSNSKCAKSATTDTKTSVASTANSPENSESQSLAAMLGNNTSNHDPATIEKQYQMLQSVFKAANELDSLNRYVDYIPTTFNAKTKIFGKKDAISKFPGLAKVIHTAEDYNAFKHVVWCHVKPRKN